jgi:hypothetical protein
MAAAPPAGVRALQINNEQMDKHGLKTGPGRKDTLNNVWATNHHVGQEVCRLFAELGGTAPTLVADAEEGNWTLE